MKLGAGLLAAALLAVACAESAAPTTAPRTISGTFTLENGEPADRSGGDCRGTRGYGDMRSGVDVTVRDAAGTIVGTARLAADSAYRYGNGCRYLFTVGPLPDSGFYSVEVGRRGDLTYSAAELDAMGWRVELDLGR